MIRKPVFLALVLVLSVGCGGGDSAPAFDASQPQPVADDLPAVLATVDGEEVGFDDLPAGTADELRALDNSYRQQRHAILEAALDEALADRMLAREAEARGMSTAEVVAAEVGTPPDPTDADVESWFRQNQARLEGRTLDQLREQIRNFLRQSRAEEAAQALDVRLREKYDVRVRLEPFRIAFDNQGSPALGPDDAAVTLVEFSDFECPFCGRFVPTVKRVEAEYGDRVRIVYRQYPIPSLHQNAFKAAEASLCAHEQGEFWPYHDLLFEEQRRLAVRDLKEKAGRLGLDQDEFDTCLDTGRYVEQVQSDQAAGEAAGVRGTPALFVNGIPIPGGAVEYDVVAAALDAELARATD